MKKFLAVYMGSPTSQGMKKWGEMDEATRKTREKAGLDAWMSWGSTHDSALVDTGSPLGKTKKVDPTGISDIKNQMTGYTIVEAENHEAAAKMFVNHPHFSLFPGDSVEIMECLPLPKI